MSLRSGDGMGVLEDWSQTRERLKKTNFWGLGFGLKVAWPWP